jgi:hypothetical protein
MSVEKAWAFHGTGIDRYCLLSVGDDRHYSS